MKNISAISRILLGIILCVGLAAPALADGKASGGNKASGGAKGSAPAKGSGKKSSAESPEQIQKKLDGFAQRTIASINRCVLPSASKKEVTQNADGTFTARYVAVDPESVSTTYKPAEDSKVVSHIGYMRYDEIEYVSTAGSHKEALNGPFKVNRRAPTTELVKYVKGKWTY